MNPTGHWEPIDAINLNVEFVTRHGLVSESSMWLDDVGIDEFEKDKFVGKIQTFLATCPEGSPLVVKEFHINELFEFWLEAACRSGFTVKTLIAIRHPREVFASLNRAFSPSNEPLSSVAKRRSTESFNTYWLKANLLAERHSRDLPRVFVEYSNLLKDWRTEIGRISEALAIDFQVNDPSIDRFLNPGLHNQRYVGPVAETFAYSWTTRVYSIFSTVAQDGPLDAPSLDEIYHGYRTNSRAFRIATSEAQVAGNKFLRDYVDGLPVWKSGRDF
jgi:hypothetical protein